MGNYNPYVSQILGQEWVPIRDESIGFSPSLNNVEYGHQFVLATPRQVRDMRLYVNTTASAISSNLYFTTAVYPAGREDQSGPIRQVIIPCNSGGITGTGLTLAGGSLSVPDAVANASDSKYIQAVFSGGLQSLEMFFATNSYSGVLAGKRILGVRLLYSMYGSPPEVFTDLVSPDTNIYLRQGSLPETVQFSGLTGPDPTDRQLALINAIDFGDVNHFWNASVGPSSTTERLPWRYTELQRFEPAPTSRISVYMIFQLGPAAAVVQLTYAALQVFYCEETRLIVAGGSAPGYGTNILTARDAATFAADPVLATGTLLATVAGNNAGDIGNGLWRQTQYPLLNACRQLYEIPSHPGKQVNIPDPLADRLGDTFTSVQTMVLPQLSLHASGGTLIEPHVYGRQVAAQVYGTNTATQDINDDLSGVAHDYPQVRFYARRFGDTTVPLTLTGLGTLSGSTVSISVTDFDTLEEIVDGWKEVTLRFGTTPSMGTQTGFPAWTWSATGETAGNRWEILGACAPAISGTPGSLFTLAPGLQQLGPATYGAGTSTPAATFVSAGVAAHGNNASVTPGMPAGIVRGDLLLLWAAIRNSPTGNPDAPTGYTQILNNSNARLFAKLYDGSESAPTVTFSDGVANATTSAQMAAFRDCTLNVINSATTSNGSQANIDYPGLSVAEDNAVVLYLGWRQQDWTGVATIAGAAEIGDPASGLGDNQGIVWDYVIQTAATAVASGSFVVTGGVNGIGRGAVLALRNATPGGEVELTWMPQGIGSPYTSTATPDATSDATILFSQDPPTVTGVGLSQLTQTVTGIGFDCGSLPCCIPSGIGYQRVTWSATSFAGSGFGAYELQRWDTTPGATFETIMLASSPIVTGFNDYEARVGLDSVYRIRVLNVYNFAGSWSSQVTGAPPTPGVTGGCSDMTGALMFTSNSDQSGASNAAYVMQWDSEPVEDFGLPEGDSVSFQPMFQRDGAVAFHGTERGLETFSRTLLIQAAAIDPIRLADVKTLRDLAWADLPYVCVRDDIGDRWFANVRVPATTARLNRTKYMARVDIVETTTSPAAVNP